jgi:hypothetical protein
MAPSRTYSTAGAFRKALEERLKKASETERIDLNRLRRHVSFDRLLARLFHAETPPWVLKGGYALELQFKAARSTVDIDLTVPRIPTEAGSVSVGILDVEKRRRGIDAGAVDNNMNSAMRFDRIVEQPLHRLALSDVDLGERAFATDRFDCFNSRLAPFSTSAGNDHLRPRLG